MINKEDKVFVKNNNRERKSVATYGWEGHGSMGFKNYYLGYKSAVETLYAKFLISAKKQEIEVTDTIVYPLCFLIRHCAELFLKYIFVTYSTATDPDKKDFFKKTSHNIANTWVKNVKPIVKALLDTQTNDIELEILDSYFRQIEEFDNSSMKMRYPCTKDNTATNDLNESLDVANMVTKILEFFNYLERIDTIIYGTTYLSNFSAEESQIIEIDEKLKQIEGALRQLKQLAEIKIKNTNSNENDNTSDYHCICLSDIKCEFKPFWERPIGKVLLDLKEEELRIAILFLYSARDLLYKRCKLVDKNTRKDFIKIMIGNIDECNIKSETGIKVLSEEHVDKISGWNWHFLNDVLEIGLTTCRI